MFRPHKGDCTQCPRTETLIVVKKGLCQWCNHEKKKAKGKTCSKILKAVDPDYKKPIGEREVFQQIAEEREWVCFVTGQKLMELTATQFMHVLPKALNKYPLFKLYKDNIQLASNEVHYKWDFVPRSELKKDPRFDKLFALEEELKLKYEQFKKQRLWERF